MLCPAGSMPALKAAIEHGADAVYVGLKDDTNARHFAGLNFDEAKLKDAVRYANQHSKKLHVAINTFAHPNNYQRWHQAVDMTAHAGADVLILADIDVLAYAGARYPKIERHLSVKASVTNAAAIDFYRQFGISRVVLPRELSMQQVRALTRSCDIDLEVFAFGSLYIMAEGRCYLSSYMTGQSPNTADACSPAAFVNWKDNNGTLESRLTGI